MNTATVKTSNTKLALDIRSEPRITLSVTLYLRRPSNSTWYRRQVKTENVSFRGARIISDVRLEPGAEVEVYGFDDRFSAIAVVKHAERRQGGHWSIGLEFTKKTGRWVVT